MGQQMVHGQPCIPSDLLHKKEGMQNNFDALYPLTKKGKLGFLKFVFWDVNAEFQPIYLTVEPDLCLYVWRKKVQSVCFEASCLEMTIETQNIFHLKLQKKKIICFKSLQDACSSK